MPYIHCCVLLKLRIMRNYRVSGYLDVEPTQVDVVAESKDHAKSIAMAHYDFEEVVNVSEL